MPYVPWDMRGRREKRRFLIARVTTAVTVATTSGWLPAFPPPPGIGLVRSSRLSPGCLPPSAASLPPLQEPQWFSPVSPGETPRGGARSCVAQRALSSDHVVAPRGRGGPGASPWFRLAGARINIRRGGAAPEVGAEGGG